MKASTRFAERLTEHLEKTQITEAELFKRAGVSEKDLWQEKGPPLDVAEKIALVFSCSLSEFLGEGQRHSLAECIRRVATAALKENPS